MTHARRLRQLITRFLRREDGAALVEFAISLPLTILIFAVIIEGSRLMIAYQTTIGGVRDAARYLSRVLPTDYCTASGSVTGYTTQLMTMVSTSATGNAVFPPLVTVNSVAPSVTCVTGTYRISPVPIATVTANVTVTFPFSGVFSLVGTTLPSITSNVSDSARVFGS